VLRRWQRNARAITEGFESIDTIATMTLNVALSIPLFCAWVRRHTA